MILKFSVIFVKCISTLVTKKILKLRSPFQLLGIPFNKLKSELLVHYLHYIHVHIFFHKQLHFQSQPGVSSEIWENEVESCLALAYSK